MTELKKYMALQSRKGFKTTKISAAPPIFVNRLRRNSSKGFSLVELIIVIAIMAILAGALAPSLIKYIEKSKLARANNNAEVAYKYATDYCAQCEMLDNPISLAGPRAQPMTAYDGTDILYDGTQTDFFNYLKKCFNTKATNTSKAKYVVVYFSTDGTHTIESATWATKKTDNLVGSYPTLAVGKSTKKYGTYYYKPNTGDQ